MPAISVSVTCSLEVSKRAATGVLVLLQAVPVLLEACWC